MVCRANACAPDAYASPEAFIADLVPAYCAWGVRCEDVHAQMACEDLANGRSSPFTAALKTAYQDTGAAVRDGRMMFDGVKAKRCLNALRSTDACESSTLDQNMDCLTMFTGTVADNGTCYVDGECGANSYCTAGSTTCPGQCQPRKAATVMAVRDRECQDGLYAYNGRCLAYATLNGSCAPVGGGPRQTCERNAFCDPSSNVCRAKGSVGATCTNADLTQCNPSLVCNNGTCQKPAALNGTCTCQVANALTGTCPNPAIICKLDLHCDLPDLSGNNPGTCKVLGAASERCWSFYDCGTTLYCEGANPFPPMAAGACTALKADNAACGGINTDFANSQCQSGYCSANLNGRCTPRKTANTPCTNPGNANECVDGYSCQNGTCRPTACHDPTP
jgi:hypothetical protein